MSVKINNSIVNDHFDLRDKAAGQEITDRLAQALPKSETVNSSFNLHNRDYQADLRKLYLNEVFDGGDKDVAKYLASTEFSQLDAGVQESLKKNLENSKNNPKAAANFIESAKSKGFRKADKNLQTAILDSIAKRPEDKIYRAELQEAAGHDDFQKLPKDKQLKMIEDLDKFAETPSYKSVGTNQVSDTDKNFLLEKIRKTSIFSSQNPINDVVRNTLDNVINGKIQLKVYEKDTTVNSNGTGSTEYGYNKSGTTDIYINRKANDADYKEFIDTLTHESNHALNGNVKIEKVSDAFLSEYRAFFAGQKGAGKTVDKNFLKSVVNNLALAEPNLDDKTKKPKDLYSEIRQTYRSNKTFKSFIDQLVKDIDKGTIIDGAAVRDRLMKAGYNDDYIENTTNTDNK